MNQIISTTPSLVFHILLILHFYSAAFRQIYFRNSCDKIHISQLSAKSLNKYDYTKIEPAHRNLKDIRDFYEQFGNVEVISYDPLLVLIKEFISPDLCHQIIESAKRKGLDTSTILNSKDGFTGRSSSTAWLEDTDVSSELHELSVKVQMLSGKPISHQENLQVLRYEKHQQYTTHTDHIEEFNELECGGRLATCLIYLNDDFKGGETEFPTLKVKVSPEKGSALFWYNTLLPEPNEWNLMPDFQLLHSGLPVESGVKWACNKWIHPVPMPGKTES